MWIATPHQQAGVGGEGDTQPSKTESGSWQSLGGFLAHRDQILVHVLISGQSFLFVGLRYLAVLPCLRAALATFPSTLLANFLVLPSF